MLLMLPAITFIFRRAHLFLSLEGSHKKSPLICWIKEKWMFFQNRDDEMAHIEANSVSLRSVGHMLFPCGVKDMQK